MEPQTETTLNVPEPTKLCLVTLTTFNHEFDELNALCSCDAYDIGRTIEVLKGIHNARCGDRVVDHRFVIDYERYYIPRTLYSQVI